MNEVKEKKGTKKWKGSAWETKNVPRMTDNRGGKEDYDSFREINEGRM